MNLWAEPVQWVKLLHRHLVSLTVDHAKSQEFEAPDQTQLHRLSAQAEAQVLGSQRALQGLSALPQFSCTMEYARLTLRHQRANLALDVLDRLKKMY